MTEPRTVLVTGATGFIGRRLVPALVEQGHDVRAMTRRPDDYDGAGTAVGGDVFDPTSLSDPLAGRRRRDLPGALPRRPRLRAQGRRRGPDLRPRRRRRGGLADRLPRRARCRRRRAVAPPALAARGRGAARLDGRAGDGAACRIIVGAGGISWELTRQLVKNLPAMVVPRWVSTPTQPIAVDDVIRYLVGVVGEPEAFGRVFEIGGPDRMTYLEMLQVAAAGSPTGAGCRSCRSRC